MLALHNVEADEASILRVAKAIASQGQRASLTLAALAHGEPDSPPTPAAKPANAVGLIELLEASWREAKRTRKSESTRESYTSTVKQLIAFLKYDEAHRVTVEDVRRFNDHLFASHKPKGQLLSPTTDKNIDLAGMKLMFGSGVANGRLIENPANDVTVARVSNVRLHERVFTVEEARRLLQVPSVLERGKELPQTFATKR